MANIEQLNVVDYSRQSELDATLTPQLKKDDIQIIVGCGGIGFWLGIQLAMLGYQYFILIDGQTVDYSNLNRLPVPQTWVGTNKAVALRKIIRSMRLDTLVLPLSTNIAKDTMSVLKTATSKLNLMQYRYNRNNRATIWDTTDDAKIQTELHKYAKTLSDTEYRKLGYEGFDIGCYKDYSVWTADDYETGYRTSNANAVTSCISAGMGIFARCIAKDDVELDLKAMIQNAGKKKMKNSDEVKRLTTILSKYRQWIANNCEDGDDDLADIDEELESEGLL